MTFNRSTHVSPHLSWAELACKDRLRTPYPADWRDTRAVALAAAFEALRAAVGLPLVVLSAFRTPTHNRLVGGAKHSQHVQGRALDLLPPKGWTVDALAAVAEALPVIVGIGLYRRQGFVHIDVRPGPRVVFADEGESAEIVTAMR